MQIKSVTLTEIHMPLKFLFRTSHGVTRERRILLVRLETDEAEGVAECAAPEHPGYVYETIDTAWLSLKEMLIPLVLGRRFDTATQLIAAWAPVRGHHMAKAALEQAFWDAQTRSWGVPLWQALGGSQTRIPVGAVLGIQPSIEETVDAMARLLAEGYRRVKLKIQPGWDVHVLEGVRRAYPDVSLTVDANSSYSLADLATLIQLDQFHLGYIEQPLAHDDLHDHAVLQARLHTPICLDESIGSPADARKALVSGAGRVINIKPSRVGGLLPARHIHDIAQAFGLPVWCGGMLETGLGRAFNLAISSLPNFTMPGDTASSSRYWDHDIIHEPIEARNGWMDVPSGPGSGVTVNWDYVHHVTVREERLQ